jgi:DEAD/DEAH box helicase domain-containing protein
VSSLASSREDHLTKKAGILSSLCKEGNDVRSKRGALVLLKDILGIPLGTPEPIENVFPWPLTVIEAPSVGVAEGVVVEKYDD